MPLTWKTGQSLNKATGWGGKNKDKNKNKNKNKNKGGKSQSTADFLDTKTGASLVDSYANMSGTDTSVKVSDGSGAKLSDNSPGGPTKQPTGSKVFNEAGTLVEDTLTKPSIVTKKGSTALVDSGFTNTQNKVTDNSHRSDLFNSESRDKFVAGSAANKAATEGAIKGKDGDRINLSANNKTVGYPHVPGVDMDTYNKVANSQKDLSGGVGSFSLLGQSIKDKYTNDGVSYNQAYYAGRLAHGKATGNDNIQSELAAEQSKLANPYSGARVVTDDMSKNAKDTLKRVTGSMAVVDDDKMSDKEKDDLRAMGVDVGGVTRDWERSGLFGENVKGTFKWKDGTTVVTKANNPVIGGKFNDVTGRIDGGTRLGDYTSATFAAAGNYRDSGGNDSTVHKDPNKKDGKIIDSLVSTGHLTGGNDGLGEDAVTTDFETDATLDDVEDDKTTIDEMLKDHSDDDTDEIDEIDEIDTLIADTTDADELKELHRRRMALMRRHQTRTRRASLLGDADVKRANLVSIL